MIRIVHLYPKEMNIYGDTGNVIALKQRCDWRGIDATVVHRGIDQQYQPTNGDIIFIGGGQDRGQLRVADDLHTKALALRTAIESGTPALAICGGYQLFGHFFRDKDGNQLDGISIFDAETVASDTRMIGNLVVESKLFGSLVGFENHSGQTRLVEEQDELGVVIKGFGNNGHDQGEGAVIHHAIGTYMHGSFLPKNPQVADWLISAAWHKLGQTEPLRSLDDTLEHKASAFAQNLPQ